MSDDLDERVQKIQIDGSPEEIKALQIGSRGYPILLSQDTVEAYEIGLMRWLKDSKMPTGFANELLEPESLYAFKLTVQIRMYEKEAQKAAYAKEYGKRAELEDKLQESHQALNDFTQKYIDKIADSAMRIKLDRIKKGQSIGRSVCLTEVVWTEYTKEDFVAETEQIAMEEFLEYLFMIGFDRTVVSPMVRRWEMLNEKIEGLTEDGDIIKVLNEEYDRLRMIAQGNYLEARFTKVLQTMDEGYFILHKLFYEISQLDKTERSELPADLELRTKGQVVKEIARLPKEIKAVYTNSESAFAHLNQLVKVYRRRGEKKKIPHILKRIDEEEKAVHARDKYIFVELGIDLDKVYEVAMGNCSQLRQRYPCCDQ